ncbi:MAG TPA: hypothetical protein VFN56_03480 [Candidatus Saccharimonadales bacterium]|nr:hypothetical protein [Candidatus Saccharimonadales bacterium]
MPDLEAFQTQQTADPEQAATIAAALLVSKAADDGVAHPTIPEENPAEQIYSGNYHGNQEFTGTLAELRAICRGIGAMSIENARATVNEMDLASRIAERGRARREREENGAEGAVKKIAANEPTATQSPPAHKATKALESSITVKSSTHAQEEASANTELEDARPPIIVVTKGSVETQPTILVATTAQAETTQTLETHPRKQKPAADTATQTKHVAITSEIPIHETHKVPHDIAGATEPAAQTIDIKQGVRSETVPNADGNPDNLFLEYTEPITVSVQEYNEPLAPHEQFIVTDTPEIALTYETMVELLSTDAQAVTDTHTTIVEATDYDPLRGSAPEDVVEPVITYAQADKNKLSVPTDIPLHENLYIQPTVLQELAVKYNEVTDALQLATPEITAQLDTIVAQINAVVELSEQAPIQNENTVEHSLDALFVELLETLEITYTQEQIHAFTLLTKYHYMKQLPEAASIFANNTQTTLEDIGTLEFLQKLQQGIQTITQSATHLYEVGKSVMRLYMQHGMRTHRQPQALAA